MSIIWMEFRQNKSDILSDSDNRGDYTQPPPHSHSHFIPRQGSFAGGHVADPNSLNMRKAHNNDTFHNDPWAYQCKYQKFIRYLNPVLTSFKMLIVCLLPTNDVMIDCKSGKYTKKIPFKTLKKMKIVNPLVDRLEMAKSQCQYKDPLKPNHDHIWGLVSTLVHLRRWIVALYSTWMIRPLGSRPSHFQTNMTYRRCLKMCRMRTTSSTTEVFPRPPYQEMNLTLRFLPILHHYEGKLNQFRPKLIIQCVTQSQAHPT